MSAIPSRLIVLALPFWTVTVGKIDFGGCVFFFFFTFNAADKNLGKLELELKPDLDHYFTFA